ncbi:hypothetical protein [Streptomyces sp. ISL-94]|uniref:hypothetical protein n=1 Tax=Streptomyces sp. ISL-94 TaxID=2819190 RepID=UPI001BE738DD|nr:hypothetical protein [Streptomyces sp. ISL-94]MBT2480859.1 hypothetical protein [Streptomyces sp. ISL-94]
MLAVALVHSTALMLERLPEKPPAWLTRGERTFAYPHKEWRKPRVWCLAFFTDRHSSYEQRKIIGVGSVFPGRRSGTYERALIARDFTVFERPLPLVELESAMGAGRRFLKDDGRMPPAAGRNLLDAVRNLRRELSEVLDGLEIGLGANPPTGEVGERLSLEKDAVGTLLEATGMDRDPLEAWQPPPLHAEDPRSRSIPFLEGLPALRQIEDQQIVHDYMHFPGMGGENAVQVGWRIYRRSTESPHRLFVFNANRTNAESVMGVDMIYVNEYAHSVAVVQYKRMRQSGSRWVYWHDGTGERELKRMEAVDADCEAEDAWWSMSHAPEAVGDPRLVTTPSMVKLCRTTPFMMNSAALIPGMYLTREHFWELLQRPEAEGPSGGTRIVEQSIPRYLNNTTFTTLLRDGWIGTRGTGSDHVIELIRRSLSSEGPGSVVVGMHRSEVPPGNRRVN